jgi:methyl-accepting chemotaxis protein
MQLTVARKITLLAGTALLGLGLLIGVGQIELKKVYDTTNYANINTVPSFIDLQAALIPVFTNRVLLWQHISADDNSGWATIEAKMAENDKIFETNAALYEKNDISNDEDKRLLDADRAAVKDYNDLRAKILPLSRLNKDKEARDLLLANQVIPAKVVDAFNKHIQFNVDLAKKSANDAIAAKGTSEIITIFISVLTVGAVGVLAYLISRGIVKPLNNCVAIANEVSKGNLAVHFAAFTRDEIGDLMQAMKRMVDNIQALVTDAGMLAKASQDGKLATRADASRHQGDFHTIVQGVNETLDTMMKPMNAAIDFLTRCSRGEALERITEDYRGDYQQIKDSVNKLHEVLYGLLEEVERLTKAGVNGQLDARADIGKYPGAWTIIVKGFNDTLDSVIGPVNEVQRVMAAIGQNSQGLSRRSADSPERSQQHSEQAEPDHRRHGAGAGGGGPGRLDRTHHCGLPGRVQPTEGRIEHHPRQAGFDHRQRARSLPEHGGRFGAGQRHRPVPEPGRC